MNILVTGGSGFIGSHVVDKLVEAGHEVRVLDIKKPYQANIEFLEGDITSREDVKKSLVDIDAVYHIAAFSNIDLVKDHPLATIEQNIMGTAYLLEECRLQKVKRFIFASSVYAYEERGHLYTTCKIASELLCKNYNTLYSLPYTILRYGTAYGPRSRRADVISLFVSRRTEEAFHLCGRPGTWQRCRFKTCSGKQDIFPGCRTAGKHQGTSRSCAADVR